MTQRQIVRLIAGFVLAPLAPATMLASQSPGLGVTSSHPSSLLVIAALLYLPSAVATSLIGVPVLVLLWRLNLVRWWSALIAGFAGGGILMSLFSAFRWLSAEWFLEDFPVFLLWSGCGAVSGLIIWLSYESPLTSNPKRHGA